MDWDRLAAAVRTAVRFLDRVVDINFSPTEAAARSIPRRNRAENLQRPLRRQALLRRKEQARGPIPHRTLFS